MKRQPIQDALGLEELLALPVVPADYTTGIVIKEAGSRTPSTGSRPSGHAVDWIHH